MGKRLGEYEKVPESSDLSVRGVVAMVTFVPVLGIVPLVRVVIVALN